MSFLDSILAAIYIQPVLFLIIIIHSYRLKMYLNSSISIRNSCEAVSLSLTLGLFMPIRTGELIKPVYIGYKENIPFSYGMAAVLIERMFDLMFFVVVSFIVLLIIGMKGEGSVLILVSLALFVLAILIFFYLKYADLIIGYCKNIGMHKLASFLQKNHRGMHAALKSAFNFKILLMGLMAWLLTLLLYIVFFKVASSNNLSFLVSSSTYIAGTLGMGVSVTPGSLGTFEAALGAVLAQEYNLKDILLTLLVFRIAISLPAAIITLVVVFRDGALIARLRKDVMQRKNA